jgi:hypothetical protein
MFSKCPKCNHALGANSAASTESCPACGLVFCKYLQALSGAAPSRPANREPQPDAVEEQSPFRRWFLYVSEDVETSLLRLCAEVTLVALSLLFGWRYYFMDIPGWEMAGTFLHTAMVPFHEFGHLLFRPFGEFMMLAGGSLAQWLIPLGFLALFCFKNRDNFAASLMLWWTGTQFIDLAPYAWDALKPQHILLTGRTGDEGAHDYIDLLGTLGLLNQAHGVARTLHELGLLLMLLAWSWGGYVVWRQYRNRVASGR